MATDQQFIDSLTVSPLAEHIDLTSFKCNDAIDWYLTNQARAHHDKRITTVMCWLKDGDLAGYITTSMTEVVLEESPLRLLYGLAEVVLRKGGSHRKRFPGLLIGMLGVCERFRRKGLGAYMVKYAIGQAQACCDAAACRFVAVDSDATPEATGMYKAVGFDEVESKKRTETVRMHFDLGPR